MLTDSLDKEDKDCGTTSSNSKNVRVILKELHLNDVNMSGSSKPINIKLSSPVQEKVNTPSVSPSIPTPSTTVAESDVFEYQSTFVKFLSDRGLDGIFDQPGDLKLKEETFIDASGLNFVGTTEGQNLELNEQQKLTFEEGFIPTLTANIRTDLDSSNKKDRQHLLASNGCETAPSSDSEFTECLSYQDFDAQSGYTGIPKVEIHRNALDADVLNTIYDEQLNAEFGEVEPKISEAIETSSTELKEDESLYQDEPMDVDITFPFDELRDIQNSVATVSQYIDSVELHVMNSVPKNENKEFNAPLSNKIEEISHNTSTDPDQCNIQQSTNENSFNNSAELPFTPKKSNDENEMRPSESLSGEDESTSASIQTEIRDIVLKKINNIKFNSTLDLSSSYCSARSSPSVSPSFPLKENTDKNKFPHSPNYTKENEMRFLEKSEYSERKDSVQKSKPPCYNDYKELNENIGKDKKSTSPNNSLNESKENQISQIDSNIIIDSLYKKKSNYMGAETLKLSIQENLNPLETNECHLQNLSSSNKDNNIEIILESNTKAKQKNQLSSPSSTENNVKINENCEPMDIDENQSPKTKNQTEKVSFTLPPTSKQRAFHELNEDLSDKEKTKSNSNDEKDVFSEAVSIQRNIIVNPFTESESVITGGANCKEEQFTDSDFQYNNNLVLNPSDFDFLLTKGYNNVQVTRNSLLLKFDPLLGAPILTNQTQQHRQQFQTLVNNNNLLSLSAAIEEEQCLPNDNKTPYVVGNKDNLSNSYQSVDSIKSKEKLQKPTQKTTENKQQNEKPIEHASMSADVIKDMNIDNDCNKTFENSISQSDEKENNFKMDELEKKIRNEVLKTEDIEKKLKECEAREEGLIKRITEKDKTIVKMHHVIEAYEKAIAELISEKEQLIQNTEKQLSELRADRDSNFQHLQSLETTFSDLHVKYEKSKQMTLQLKGNEECLLTENRQLLENVRLQEQRYDKMKNHAMQQLEIANQRLESLMKDHTVEITKLKALLKKEEISRASVKEQLEQKSRENEELVKICDELINGQGS